MSSSTTCKETRLVISELQNHAALHCKLSRMSKKKKSVNDSNETKVMAIQEALQIYSRPYHDILIAGSDSSNVISWVSSSGG